MNCHVRKKRSDNRKKRTATAFIAVLLAFSASAAAIISYMMERVEKEPVFMPDAEKADMDKWRESENINPDSLSGEQYGFLLEQTGLGRSAVDSLRNSCNGFLSGESNKTEEKYMADEKFFNEIKKAQQNFYGTPEYSCDRIGLFSENERFRDGNGKKINYYELVDLRKGDVLISMSTHTLGYRHGHCGLVIKEPEGDRNGRTLEAVYWGKATEICSASRWCSCPTLLHLRVSAETAEKLGYTQTELGEKIADFALENCEAVKYSLIPRILNMNSDAIRKTHCSHLVWYVYNEFGIDIDSDGGYIVTPWDIAASRHFEIVQAYGIDLDSLGCDD
ncbi:MAG: hypothetical protein ACI4LO_00980 [Anaerovoracaceae bacterium]